MPGSTGNKQYKAKDASAEKTTEGIIVPSQEYLDEQRFYEYLAAIDKRILAAGGDGWDCLSPPERATLIGYRLACEISNGGFEQFFINPAGDNWSETREVLKMVGAVRLAVMFDEALSVFPSGAPSTDQLARRRQYDAAGDHARRVMEELTGKYYDLQGVSDEHCLYRKLSLFAIRQLENERKSRS